MRRFARSPKRDHRAFAQYYPMVFSFCGALACGGQRFQSQADAGQAKPVADESDQTPTTSIGEPAVTTAGPSNPTSGPMLCDGEVTCQVTTNTPASSELDAALVQADAGASDTPSLADAGTAEETSESSSVCADLPSCFSSSGATTVTSNHATTSQPVSTNETTSEPLDECPDINDQDVRGSCGCGFEPLPACDTLASHLTHRYTFDGEGTQLTDVVGEAHGVIYDCELEGAGQLEFDGEGCYVALPSGMISAFDDVTLEMWVRWHGGESNQRIFNFGTAEAEGVAPSSFISLSPRSGDDETLTLSYLADPDDSSQSLRADMALESGDVEHLSVVVDGAQGRLSLFLWGELLASMDSDQYLTELEDRTVWLGRALYSEYPFFRGSVLEFRVYDTALGEDELAQSVVMGLGATHLWPR